jgi:flagellar basal body-associated protein FliL
MNQFYLMKKFIKKIVDLIWTLLGGITVLFAVLAAMLGSAFLLWPRKSRERVKGGEKSNIGWLFYPHLFKKTFSNKIYVLIILILAAIIGIILFFTYF